MNVGVGSNPTPDKFLLNLLIKFICTTRIQLKARFTQLVRLAERSKAQGYTLPNIQVKMSILVQEYGFGFESHT